ncbi:hypothetical protein PTTG_03917 [Puccinia triticina 1-1 BBBD Race 1]|uniref:Uncharacterized protein n=2 Tax=Puccinia triticina TaxID=208348 RepID=A0A0C4ESY8_PUCT1|nr:uncharacterized protein PtA15_14A487 [Puccinia triticina]OAV92319.1 hypothetical protein PTTG_03917 [Puccinia triticina 1-1 BBBD Race 1]WAQ91603.1 hypothetical protein PtA15_14A487 [Puccinia triticina]WAR62408.1 hypothetical protein PtB15_14B503 [Puccinia triticina]
MFSTPALRTHWLACVVFSVLLQSLVLLDRVAGLPSQPSALFSTERMGLASVDKAAADAPQIAAPQQAAAQTSKPAPFDPVSPINPPGRGCFNPAEYTGSWF